MPFKVYSDFKCDLRKIHTNKRGNSTSYTVKNQNYIPNTFGNKLVRIGAKFSKPVVLYGSENLVYKFIDELLKSMIIAKKSRMNILIKILSSVEDEKRFQSSNKYWIWNKSFTDEDKKVRDHDHITGKYRGSTQSDRNINLKWTKNVPVTFHDLRDYDSHLIMQKLVNLR